MKQKKVKAIMLILSATLCVQACAKLPAKTVEDEVAENLNIRVESNQEDETDSVVEEVEETAEEVEIEVPDVASMTDETLDTIEMQVSESDGEGNSESNYAIEDEDVNMQIVFLGDSIFDSVRDETGIAAQVGRNLHADVYNLAIGGTSAGMRTNKSTDFDKWNDCNFNGMTYAMTGDVDKSIMAWYKAGEVFDTCDFSKTDYFIVEYGTNDFLSYIPLGSTSLHGDYYFYFRTSMDIGITHLQENYPDAKIIICTPYYEEFWSADRTRYIGDIHTTHNGYGTLMDYISILQDVGRDHEITCLNMYNLLDVTINNVNDMTVDGIHPSEEARNKYADILTYALKEMDRQGWTSLDFQEQEMLKAEAAKAEAEAAAETETSIYEEQDNSGEITEDSSGEENHDDENEQQ